MNPDKLYGPKLANIFQEYCKVVLKECGATAIRVEAEFEFRNGEGNLKLKTFTTPDTKFERMLDPDVPMSRGSKLQHDVTNNLLKITKKVLRKKRGTKP